MIDQGMTAAKLTEARKHVYNVCNQGQTVELIKPGTKDEMGYMLNESTLSLKAHPPRFSPYDRRTHEKISWVEETDIICFVSKKAIDDMSLTMDGLRLYKRMRHNKKTYDIKYIEPYSSFANDYLYVVIGGKK